MPNKMLIDASHPEETRVVVTRGNRIEEFDFESQDKKQLKGNIYLARVTRVEPSLQAAFVEYGGNRHGFLAFSEIHPDYYQIPVADRQALLKAEAEAAQAEDDEEENGEDRRGRRRRKTGGRSRGRASGGDNGGDPASQTADAVSGDEESGEAIAAAVDSDRISELAPAPDDSEDGHESAANGMDAPRSGDEGEVESVGAEDALEEVRAHRKPIRRSYKIQEVVKRRQILLVQVVKEERGNKGAALTTYLSLAGRYSVLMPNTARGGGISRKITSAVDRKRLKEVVRDLDVPQGMGVILRTAGESRTKAEIKRDYEYLMRLWENVRNLTLSSTAPALVYEEGSLIKRSVRDLYNKDINEILVAGDEGYREAKDFMRMLMPSHAKVVQPYRDTTPIFARNGIEAQLDRMLQPQVTLKSGGYIIINQTEALVSIDVNSGRSTKEHSIEDTALQTNLEAADEVARQLRLRDLAGLIVIDFIDMEENRNNRAVEKRMKDCLKNDRARIQVGRISHFGLLEMSRQRIRASVLESTMKPCPHCGGTGHVRSDSSIALHVVRTIEEYLLKDNRSHLIVRTSVATALYVLNHKRATLVDLEHRFGLTISIEVDDTVGAQLCTIMRGAAVENPLPLAEIAPPPIAPEPEDEEIVEDIDEAEDESTPARGGAEPGRVEQARPDATADTGDGDGNRDRKRRRRRRRRGGRDREQPATGEQRPLAAANGDDDGDGDEADATENVEATASVDAAGEAEPKKRRRGKRGGKRNQRETAVEAETGTVSESSAIDDTPEMTVDTQASGGEPETPAEIAEAANSEEPAATAPEPEPKPKRARRAPKKAKAEVVASDEAASTEPAEVVAAVEAEPPVEHQPAAPARPSRRKAVEAEAASEPVVSSSSVEAPANDAGDAKPKKGGWWQRKSFF